jgi:ABC-type bacteriocin/lantibiotic exporter with double-glycine peptidase domain
MENSLICTRRLFDLIKLPYTTAFLREKLLTHPEPESLLSISDTLAEYKVESLALQIGADKLDQLPLPCVVQIHQNPNPYFSCLSQVSADRVEYLDDKGKTSGMARTEFNSKWTGVALVMEKGEEAGEPGYQQRVDYDLFAARYAMIEELAMQEPMIKAIQDWAEQERVTHTPTIFINGYELPSAYAVEDLKYVLD